MQTNENESGVSLSAIRQFARRHPELAYGLLGVLATGTVFTALSGAASGGNFSFVPIVIVLVLSLLTIAFSRLARNNIMISALAYLLFACIISYISINMYAIIYHNVLMVERLSHVSKPWYEPPVAVCAQQIWRSCTDIVPTTVANTSTTPAPNPLEVPTQTDFCEGITPNTESVVVKGAEWCGGPGATRTTIQQAFIDRTPSCIQYAAQTFANLNQNQLYRESISLAKAKQYDEAFTRIHACQCHNSLAQALMEKPDERRNMLCWLAQQAG